MAELGGFKKFEAAGGGTPEQQIIEQIERQRSYERAIEGAEERISSTTLPWEARMAVRDFEFEFVDAPPGLGDNWGTQRLYGFLESRRSNLLKLSGSEETRGALGYSAEPWRDTPIISRQNQNDLRSSLLGQGVKAEDLDKEVERYIKDASERIPLFCQELERSRDELARERKIFYLYWSFKNAASGQEVGEIYLQSKLPNLPRPKDFALMLKAPSYFMAQNEAGTLPGYPQQEDREKFLESKGMSKENEPLGETTEKEARLIYLVALSENPERVIEWKHRTEREELYKLFRNRGVNSAYLILKEKGIDYQDKDEESRIQEILSSLDGNQKQAIKDAWWKKLGFKGEQEGIEVLGDPEMWIPTKARRGDPPAESSSYLQPGFDRATKIGEIGSEVASLKKLWKNLSPLNNLSVNDQENIKHRIEAITDRLRELGARRVENGKLITVFPTLPLERELGLRKGPTEIGCIWSKPQTAGDKEKLTEQVLSGFVHGDKLAYEQAKALTEMFGFQSKWGYYGRDYDPTQKGTPNDWVVEVEGWPYTNEFQIIMTWPWYQRYKAEAGGPEGSRGKFGPLMTDYLGACVSQEFDGNGNSLYIIVDFEGKLRKGRADEGVIITDTNSTLLEHWEKGESLGDTKLWEGIIEDPYRRFLLRGFFAEGKVALGPGGNALLDIWKKRDWKLEDLDSDKFWDDYNLARRVALREELFGEIKWKEAAAEVDEEYRKNAAESINLIRSARTQAEREKRMSESASIYKKWKEDRKAAVWNYADKAFGDGILSTEMMNIATYVYNMEQTRVGNPKETTDRIMQRAEAHDVHLGWNVDKIFSLMSQLKGGKGKLKW